MRRKEAGFIAAQAAIFVGVIALVSLPLQFSNNAQVSTSSTVSESPLVFASGVAPDGLQLKMVLNATSMRPGGAIFGNVTVVNTSDQNATVPTQQSQNITTWDYYNDNCMIEYFIGYAVFSGHYAAGNISSAGTPLELVPRMATAGCPGGPLPSPITFLPTASGPKNAGMVIDPARPHDSFRDLINVTTDVCKDTKSLVEGCPASFPGLVGYWNMSASPPTVVPFSPGEYTVVAWDDWNQYVYATFVVERSTLTSLTSTYVNGSSGLSLYLGINSTVLTTGQNLSVSISEYNSANTPQNVSVAAHWPTSNLTLYPCGRIGYPFGVAVLRGNYEEGNLSLGTTLQIVEGGSQSCPSTPSSNNYYFETHSDKAAFSGDCTPSSVSCGQSYYMSQTITITGYWTGGVPVPMEPLTLSVLHPLQPGEYTVVGGDEWGAEIILHFVVQG